MSAHRVTGDGSFVSLGGTYTVSLCAQLRGIKSDSYADRGLGCVRVSCGESFAHDRPGIYAQRSLSIKQAVSIAMYNGTMSSPRSKQCVGGVTEGCRIIRKCI